METSDQIITVGDADRLLTILNWHKEQCEQAWGTFKQEAKIKAASEKVESYKRLIEWANEKLASQTQIQIEEIKWTLNRLSEKKKCLECLS